MSAMNDLYEEFHYALHRAHKPEGSQFGAVWNVYLEAVDQVSTRFTELQREVGIAAAEKVQVYLAWAEPFARIGRDMPLEVPAPTVRVLHATGRFAERTAQVSELGEFLRVNPRIVRDLSRFAQQQLGRHAQPVVDELEFVYRAATLTYEWAARTVPGIEVEN